MTKKYPLVEKYFGRIINKRRKLKNADKSLLLQVIDEDKANKLEKLLQDSENKVANFKKIFQILPELNNKTDPDEKINDMVAELRAASLLNDKGFTNIVYQRESFDFSCRKNKNQYAVEVEFIRGPNFKMQKRLAPGLGYKLDPNPEIKRLKDKIGKGFSQLRSNFHKIVIIVTNNVEMEKFWFGDKIEKFRKKMGKQLQSKIFIATNNDIYG